MVNTPISQIGEVYVRLVGISVPPLKDLLKYTTSWHIVAKQKRSSRSFRSLGNQIVTIGIAGSRSPRIAASFKGLAELSVLTVIELSSLRV